MKNLEVITKKEKALLNRAIKHCRGEIKEPAKDDSNTMETIASLYDKKLITINFEMDKLFINDNCRGLLCI